MAEKNEQNSVQAFKKKSEKDLVKMLNEKREERRSFRFNIAGSATRDVRAIRNNKREIAQILTELNARHKRIAREQQSS